MLKVEDRKKLVASMNKLGHEALNIKGVVKNTPYDVFVDDLDNPKGFYVNDRYFNFVYSKNMDFIKSFDNEKKDACYFGFSGTTKEVFDYFTSASLIQWLSLCSQYHFEGSRFEEVMALDSLTLDDLDFVNDNYEYKNDDSKEKIKDAILNRPTSCLRIDNQLVSFVLLHDDDSIGYMYTLPEYRGKGYAYELTKDIVNKTIDSGRLPYIQIVHGNIKSEKLAEKAGFIKHADVYWFGIVRHEHVDIIKYIDRFKEIHHTPAKSITTRTHLSLLFRSIPIEINKDHIIYENEVYHYLSHFEDEIYYIKVDEMPEMVLKSFLIEHLKEEYELCLINHSIETSGFKVLSVEK